MDYTPLMEDVRRTIDQGNALLQRHRLVACMGSRIALTLFISCCQSSDALVGAGTCQDEAIEQLRSSGADLLLCTDRLEQGNGGALVAAAKQLDPAPATLMVVTQPRRLMTIRLALEAGCDGLCLESRMGQGTVVQALTTVSTGAAYIDRSLHAQYFQSYPGLGDAPLARLSEREVQVLERVTSGKSNRVIAAELFLSVETVKSHLSRIAQKLQARDRVHAAVKGIRLGLVDWPEPR